MSGTTGLEPKDRILLTLAEDPDGDGPRTAGEKIMIRPKVSELRARVVAGADMGTECKSYLDSRIADAKSTMAPPTPLTEEEHNARMAKEAKPEGAFPTKVMEGTPIMDDEQKASLGLR